MTILWLVVAAWLALNALVVLFGAIAGLRQRRLEEAWRATAAGIRRWREAPPGLVHDHDPIEGLPEQQLLRDAFGPAGAAVPEYEFVRRLNDAAHQRLARRRAIETARTRLALLPGPFGSGQDEEMAQLVLALAGLRREVP